MSDEQRAIQLERAAIIAALRAMPLVSDLIEHVDGQAAGIQQAIEMIESRA